MTSNFLIRTAQIPLHLVLWYVPSSIVYDFRGMGSQHPYSNIDIQGTTLEYTLSMMVGFSIAIRLCLLGIYPGKSVASYYSHVISTWWSDRKTLSGKVVCSFVRGFIRTAIGVYVGTVLSSSGLTSALRSLVDGSRRVLTSFLRLKANHLGYVSRLWVFG